MSYRYPGNALGSRPATRTFVLDPDQTLAQTFDDLQQGIRIDNLSFVWLYVEPLQRFVPPLRVGWRGNIMPGSRTITVRPVDSPTGQNPVDTGNPQTINIEIGTEPIDESEGTDATFTSTGTANITTGLEVYNSTHASSATPDTPENEDIIIALGADIGIRLRIIQLRMVSLAATRPTLWTEIQYNQFSSDEPFAYLGISPSMPTDWIIIPDNGIFVPYSAADNGCKLVMRNRCDQADQAFRLLFGYHRVQSV